MYTILPIHQMNMPRSFMFETLEEAVAGAKADFADPYTPDTKGFMVVDVVRAVGVTRALDETLTLEDFLETKDEDLSEV